MDSFGLSIYKIMSPTNSDSFISSFPMWIPFVSFSCLIALAGTSNTMLNKSGDSRHPCLVPVFRPCLIYSVCFLLFVFPSGNVRAGNFVDFVHEHLNKYLSKLTDE